MIKESGIVFQNINLCKQIVIKAECHINDIGLKWLCKTNLGNIVTLKIGIYYSIKAATILETTVATTFTEPICLNFKLSICVN